MLDSAKLSERLKALPFGSWRSTAFRHMFGSYPPDRENTSGARWNPAGVAAIYASLTREGALAEAEHQIAVQPIRPRARRSIYELFGRKEDQPPATLRPSRSAAARRSASQAIMTTSSSPSSIAVAR